jgi:prolyl-tRNA synthetase
MKSLVMAADGKLVLVLVRGDHSLSETKFAGVMSATEVRPAHPEEIRGAFGADAGSLGPVGVRNMRILADRALKGRRNMIAGANEDDYHLRHVTPGEDFTPEYHDLRQAAEGDACIKCGGALRLEKTVEIGHIFKLGYKYSQSMGLRVLNAAGQEITPIMGSYGIGVERILCAAIELYHDKDGMSLPPSIAPFEVVITPVNNSDEAQCKAARDLYATCLSLGLDALLDDRDERPGVKFKDADLIGVPYRITVGKKLVQGKVEVVNRRTRETTEVAIQDAPEHVRAGLKGA